MQTLGPDKQDRLGSGYQEGEGQVETCLLDSLWDHQIEDSRLLGLRRECRSFGPVNHSPCLHASPHFPPSLVSSSFAVWTWSMLRSMCLKAGAYLTWACGRRTSASMVVPFSVGSPLRTLHAASSQTLAALR